MGKKIAPTTLALALILAPGVAATHPTEASRDGSLATGVALSSLLGLSIAGAYTGPRTYYPGLPLGPGLYRAALLSRAAAVRVGRAELLAQSLREIGLPRWRVAMLAPRNLRLKPFAGSS